MGQPHVSQSSRGSVELFYGLLAVIILLKLYYHMCLMSCKQLQRLQQLRYSPDFASSFSYKVRTDLHHCSSAERGVKLDSDFLALPKGKGHYQTAAEHPVIVSEKNYFLLLCDCWVYNAFTW